MFKLKTKKGVLETILACIATISDEAVVAYSPKGLALQLVDSAHVAMLDLKAAKNLFDGYESTTGTVGLDVVKLKALLTLAGSNDEVTLEYADKSDRIVVKFGDIRRNLGALNTDGMASPKIPDMTFTHKSTFRSDYLARAVKAAGQVHDAITVQQDGKSLVFLAKGDSDEVQLRKTEEIVLQGDGVAKAQFSLDYLDSISKAVGVSAELALESATDRPLRIKMQNGDLEATFLVAPRIESE